MRALASASLPIEVAVVFFRDPTARLAVVVKLSFRLLGRAGAELSPVPEPLSSADFVPRKQLAEILVTGEAFSAEPAAVIPIQIAMGGKLQLRSEIRAPGGIPALRAPLNGFGPIPPRFSLAAPFNAKEASFSDAWLSAPRDGFQVAPPDQRTPEMLGPATPLSFFNLSPGGGIMGLTLPRVAPFALLVEGAGAGNAHRAAMRCDTVHLDTSGSLLHLGYRGEVELDRFATVPDLVVGLLSGQQVPRAADIQTAFASGVELPLHRLGSERVGAMEEVREALNQTQRVSVRPKSSTLPFARQGAKSTRPVGTPFSAPPSPPPPDDLADARGPRGTLSVAAGVVFPTIGNWRLGALIRDQDERIMYDAKHVTSSVRARLTCLSSRDEGAAERFRADVARRARVVHSGLAAIIELGGANERPFLVESVLPGELLAHVLGRGPVALERALTIWRGVVAPLVAVHAAGFVFGSLSPKLIAVDGDRVTLEAPTGFREPLDGRAPKPRLFVDDAYASPEVRAEQWAEVSERSDVWSLGALLLALLAGKPVGRQSDPAFPSIGAKLQRVLMRARSDNPHDRQADALALLREVDEAKEPSFTMPPTIDDEPTADPRGTLPLIDGAVLAMLAPPSFPAQLSAERSITDRPGAAEEDDHPTLPPAPSDDMETTVAPESADDEHPTIPPPVVPGRPRLPAFHVDAETTSLLDLPRLGKQDEERTGLIQLPIRPAEKERALPFAPRAPSTGRPPPPKDDAIPFFSPDSTSTGRETLLESAIAAAALPFAASPTRTPPAPRPSARGGTPWEKVPSTAPPPEMGPEQNGGTLPPPPPVNEVALARSFGQGAGFSSPRSPTFSLPSVWRDPPTRATTLDAATIARVVTAKDPAAAVLATEISRIDFALGLEEWLGLLDADAREEDDARLNELLSALHVEALAAPRPH